MSLSPEELLEQVRAAADGFEVFGELGRKHDGDVWFLAREQGATPLVALRLTREPSASEDELTFSLEVAKELGGNVAMGDGNCWKCHATVRSFARFCGKCGADQTAGTRVAHSDAERRIMLGEVRAAAADHYDVLGEMSWAGGAGAVYFALERGSGQLVRLRLRQGEDGFELGETAVGLSLSGQITASYLTQMGAPALPAPDVPPSGPSAPLPAAAPTPPERPAARSSSPGRGRERVLMYVVIGLSVLVLLLLVVLVFK